MSAAEPVTITFTRYRTDKGEPTCVRNIFDGSKCEWFGETREDGEAACRFHADLPPLRYEPGPGPLGTGHYVPHARCPLWVDA